MCLELFSLRRMCTNAIETKVVSIRLSKILFHVICVCLDDKRAIWFQCGWAKEKKNGILAGSLNVGLRTCPCHCVLRYCVIQQ